MSRLQNATEPVRPLRKTCSKHWSHLGVGRIFGGASDDSQWSTVPETRRIPAIVHLATKTIMLLLAGSMALGAQARKSPKQTTKPVKLSAVLTAFLVDSGVRTRALPWTTGSELPVAWDSLGPVATRDEEIKRLGLTTTRTGKFRGQVGDRPALPMVLMLSGVEMGLARVSVGLEMNDVTREQVEQALIADGMTLQPLKCSRAKETASYGNLLDAAKVPGKTASGLWWIWNCAHDGCTLTLTILYRKTDSSQVECFSG